MKKKILAMCLVVALAATAIAGATLAYFTDTDEATNVFVSGNFDLVLQEYERVVKDGKFVPNETDEEYWGDNLQKDFVDGKKLLPVVGDVTVRDDYGMTADVVSNYQDKIVQVALEDNYHHTTPAYVRVTYAVPADLEDNGIIVVDLADELSDWKWVAADTVEKIEVNGVMCNIHTYTYNEALTAEQFDSQPLMFGVYMPSTVDQVTDTAPITEEESITVKYVNKAVENGKEVEFTARDAEGFTIPVFAQAVQAEGFDTPADAFAASGLLTGPWAPKA